MDLTAVGLRLDTIPTSNVCDHGSTSPSQCKEYCLPCRPRGCLGRLRTLAFQQLFNEPCELGLGSDMDTSDDNSDNEFFGNNSWGSDGGEGNDVREEVQKIGTIRYCPTIKYLF